MKTKFFAGAAIAALITPVAAYAQSTGTVDFDNTTDIVVTGSRIRGVGGVQVPDTTKAKGVLTQEFIARQTPGNSILDTINQLPGVSFQNNDPFGSAGGTLTIRGFDASRISLTFDGIPLNDTGNYALYSNQQLDPELIDQVNVNYGSTDVDSPTAAATGSTVNYRTRDPFDQFGARLEGSIGDFNFFRIFGIVDTGVFTPFGTKAFFSASHAENDWFVNDFGKIDKQQYNGKIYQPIGSNGDFISVAGNYNENRNNFGGSAPLRIDPTVLTITGTAPNQMLNSAPRLVGTGTNNRFPTSNDEIPYHVARCTTTQGRAGLADSAGSCGTTFDERFNPSNTGNIRINSRFTLTDGLVLTVDPSFQYTKANGGGTNAAREGLFDIDPSTTVTTLRAGYFGGNAYAGRDLNGDGDTLDQVNILAPSQTQTRRYGVIAGLRYDINDMQTIRVGYTFDRGRHRQTGETGFLQINGSPFDVFPVNDPIVAGNAQVLQKRDRLSFATLHQVYGEYRGEFFDSALTINLGVTGKFFERDLTNNCFTSSAGGFVECFGDSDTLRGEIAAAHPYSVNSTTGVPVANAWAPPQSRVIRYSRALPSGGLTYRFNGGFTVFGNYSKGIQVPGTDNLYNAFFFPVGSDQATPSPETTDNFDVGVRYISPKLQISVGPWYTRFTNRLASAFDPDTQVTIYRNLGRVDKYGVDGQLDFRPIPEVLFHLFGSYLKSEIKNDVQTGTSGGVPVFAATAGKRESGAPVYTFGGRVQGSFGPVDVGAQAKRTGRRYLNDQNLPISTTYSLNGVTVPYQAYGATTPAYTLVDLDARLKMGWAGLNDTTYLQLNVLNVFDEYYIGGFSGGSTSTTSIPFVQIGTPRTFVATLNVQF